MSIKRLLLVAGVLSVGACGGWGPTGACYLDDQLQDQVCASVPATSQPSSGNLPIAEPET